MTQEDIENIARTILDTHGVEGFVLVIGAEDQTIVLCNNCSLVAAGDLMRKAAEDVADGGQRPALFS